MPSEDNKSLNQAFQEHYKAVCSLPEATACQADIEALAVFMRESIQKLVEGGITQNNDFAKPANRKKLNAICSKLEERVKSLPPDVAQTVMEKAAQTCDAMKGGEVQWGAVGEMPEAEDVEQVEITKKDPDICFLMAEAFEKTGNTKDAITAYKDGLRNCFDAENSYPYHKLNAFMDFLYNLGRHNEMLEFFQELVESARQNNKLKADILNYKGKYYARLKRHEEAVKTYEEACNAYPENDTAYYLIGQSFEQLGRQQEAISYYIKAFDINRSKLSYRSALYNLFHQLGETDQAISFLQTVASEDKNNPQAYKMLGNYLRRLCILKEAKEAYEKALEFDPNNTNIKEKLNELKSRL